MTSVLHLICDTDTVPLAVKEWFGEVLAWGSPRTVCASDHTVDLCFRHEHHSTSGARKFFRPPSVPQMVRQQSRQSRFPQALSPAILVDATAKCQWRLTEVIPVSHNASVVVGDCVCDVSFGLAWIATVRR